MFITVAIIILLSAAYAKYVHPNKEKTNEQEKEKLEKSLISLKEVIDQTLMEYKNTLNQVNQ